MIDLGEEGTVALQEVAAAITAKTDAAGTVIIVLDYHSDDDADRSSRRVNAQIILSATPSLQKHLPHAMLHVASEIASLLRRSQPENSDGDQQTTQC